MFNFFKNLFTNTNKNPTSETPTDTMNNFLIIGLGNIGNEYALTRHNVGFLALDRLASALELTWKTDRLGDICEFKHKGRTFILLKPSTYMNLSGKAAKYWLDKKKIDKERMLIVVDEINLPFGKLRLRGNGSDGGHNGLKNITEVLQTPNYARLRVGVGGDFAKGKQVEYVLGTWTDEEMAALPPVLDSCAAIIRSFGMSGLELTMTQYNKK
jgi:PTH1 family peptidyl-tRNA hydrolase